MLGDFFFFVVRVEENHSGLDECKVSLKKECGTLLMISRAECLAVTWGDSAGSVVKQVGGSGELMRRCRQRG